MVLKLLCLDSPVQNLIALLTRTDAELLITFINDLGEDIGGMLSKCVNDKNITGEQLL